MNNNRIIKVQSLLIEFLKLYFVLVRQSTKKKCRNLLFIEAFLFFHPWQNIDHKTKVYVVRQIFNTRKTSHDTGCCARCSFYLRSHSEPQQYSVCTRTSNTKLVSKYQANGCHVKRIKNCCSDVFSDLSLWTV